MCEIKILIDPGHGGNDTGATFNRLYEKDLNLKIAEKLYEEIKKFGVEVEMTRTEDKTLEWKQRTQIVNKSDADIVLSVHCNSYNSKAKGAETIYSKRSDGKLAEIILDEFEDWGFPTRRSFKRVNDEGEDYYFMHRETEVTEVVIIECGFLDNKDDRKYLTDKNDQDKIARLIALGTFKYMYKHLKPFGEEKNQRVFIISKDGKKIEVPNEDKMLAGGHWFLQGRLLEKFSDAVIKYDPSTKTATFDFSNGNTESKKKEEE